MLLVSVAGWTEHFCALEKHFGQIIVADREFFLTSPKMRNCSFNFDSNQLTQAGSLRILMGSHHPLGGCTGPG